MWYIICDALRDLAWKISILCALPHLTRSQWWLRRFVPGLLTLSLVIGVMWSMGDMAFRTGASYCKSGPSLVWCPWTFCRWIYNVYDFTRDPTWPPPWGVMRIYGWELLAVCNHLDKSCDHKYYNGDIMFLIGRVTSSKHMFKGHVYLWVETPHGESPPCLVWWLLVWCMSLDLQQHVIERSVNFVSASSLWYVTTLPSLVVIGIAVVEIWCFCLSRDQARQQGD